MIDYATNPGWATPSHLGVIEKLTKDEQALNKEGVLEALVAKHNTKACADFRGDKAVGLVTALLDPATTLVIMVKGAHQAKFGTGNVRDQIRVDQTHYQVRYSGAAHHIYVQPNLAGKWEVTEIT